MILKALPQTIMAKDDKYFITVIPNKHGCTVRSVQHGYTLRCHSNFDTWHSETDFQNNVTCYKTLEWSGVSKYDHFKIYSERRENWPLSFWDRIWRYPSLREMTWLHILVQIYKSHVKPKFKPMVCIYDTDQPLLAEMFVVCLRRGYFFL